MNFSLSNMKVDIRYLWNLYKNLTWVFLCWRCHRNRHPRKYRLVDRTDLCPPGMKRKRSVFLCTYSSQKKQEARSVTFAEDKLAGIN